MADSSDEETEVYPGETLITDDEDEIMPSEDDDDDDDDDDEDDEDDFTEDKFKQFKIERKKDEMASDIEDDNEEDYLPNSHAWGKDKKVYYDTDYVDKDFRSQKHKEEELAQYEEEEALAIQKRLLESVKDSDIGIDFLIDSKRPELSKIDVKETTETKKEKVQLKLTGLSEDKKLAIIKQESPELELLMSDLKRYLHELETQIEPILKYLQQQNSGPSSGLKYLKLRYFALLNYCVNITFYLSLMSSQDKQNVKEHPIIKEIFMHKKLISELDSCFTKKGSKFSKEIEFVAQSLQKGEKINFLSESSTEGENVLTTEELLRSKTSVSKATTENSDGDVHTEDEMDEDGFKRAITYQMEKNKGLIPKRQRVQRNPRVKYRKKFEKAIIRRKGQVREPRKEIRKYGGELTGINPRTVKSVKFR